MRILKVEFQNLNSLVGHWKIDFTDSAYSENGLFTITGPTGAGKSTILDAICLGLYACTPRLERITKNDNEIMSRQTGECFSEVTFQNKKGTFRCRWQQQRARRKSDGALQNASHEIIEISDDKNNKNDKVHETGLTNVANKVIEITGMKFEQFTRSVLLAQGNFAAFLQASANEKSPILEQITGTAFYSEISKLVHQRNSEENKKLTELKLKLQGATVLTAEEETEENALITNKKQEEIELKKTISEKEIAINWLKEINRLEKEFIITGERKVKNEVNFIEFEPEIERLRLHNETVNLRSDYDKLLLFRDEIKTKSAELTLTQEKQTEYNQDIKIADENLTLYKGKLELIQQEKQLLTPKIQHTRELDVFITAKKEAINDRNNQITGITSNIASTENHIEQNKTQLNTKNKNLTEIENYLSEYSMDNALVEKLSGFKLEFNELKNIDNNSRLIQQQVIAKQNELQQISNELTQENAKKLQEDAALVDLNNDISLNKNNLDTLLAGKSLADWNQIRFDLNNKKQLIANTQRHTEAFINDKEKLSNLINENIQLTLQKNTAEKDLISKKEKKSTLENMIRLLEQQWSLQQTIQSLEEHRKALVAGEPCPLCGSKDHPYAEGNTPELSQIQTTLATERQYYAVEIHAISVIEAQLNILTQSIEKNISEQESYRSKIALAQLNLTELFSQLNLNNNKFDEDSINSLKLIQEKNESELKNSGDICSQAEKINTTLVQLQSKFGEKSQLLNKINEKVSELTYKNNLLSENLKSLDDNLKQTNNSRQQKLAEIQENLSIYIIENISIEHLDKIYLELENRKNKWQDYNQKKLEIQQLIAQINAEINSKSEQLLIFRNDLMEQSQKLSIEENECNVSITQRKEILGDKNPNEEEARLQHQLTGAENDLNAIKEDFKTKERLLLQSKNDIERLNNEIKNKTNNIELIQSEFLFKLKEKGFIDEANYQSSCLSDDSYILLKEKEELLKKEKFEIAVREKELDEKIRSEKEKNISKLSFEDLEDELLKLKEANNNLLIEIGGIEQRLKDNNELKQKMQQHLIIIEKQQKECKRWNALDALIGSANGTAYRNFVQGLTFEIMVDYANQQLQKMSDRYLLLCDETNGLTLNVLDNYQAGEIRSTKNLSGGESFIVSLALALGLSKMASKNISVDSLFLDEGFGTLDEEALETALETLANLQGEGKLIGVISHVPALKERINTQIQITPETGGKSKITGAGCTEIK